MDFDFFNVRLRKVSQNQENDCEIVTPESPGQNDLRSEKSLCNIGSFLVVFKDDFGRYKEGEKSSKMIEQ